MKHKQLNCLCYMNKFSSPLLDLIIHVMTSLISSTVKRPKSISLKILMCPEINKEVMHQLIKHLPKSP